jgi:hypothetical protein
VVWRAVQPALMVLLFVLPSGGTIFARSEDLTALNRQAEQLFLAATVMRCWLPSEHWHKSCVPCWYRIGP